jgi:dTDP-4-amino-4,6-dideoxygalactose transaminase
MAANAQGAILPVNQLAIATGKPQFAQPLHVGRPNLGSQEALLTRIQGALERRWLTNYGPLVQEFEQRLRETLQVRHCIPICNGTIALEVAIRALELRGEVIVPSFTFIASVHALEWQGITPVFCDVAEDSHNLDPEQVERLVTSRTSGILGVHVWGKACDHERLLRIAADRRLKLMYDAAHAFRCGSGGKYIGSFGCCEVFSFHATKFFNTFEGGAIATNDDELARKIRLLINFGFAGIDRVTQLGINGKMNEICAAMGLTGLESLDDFVAVNYRNYQVYGSYAKEMPGIKMVSYDEREPNNYQYIIFETDEKMAGISRDELLRVLEAENILARRYFYPGCHRMEPYRSKFPAAGRELPRTEALCDRVLALPTGTSVEVSDIERICSVIRTALAFPEECRRLLRATLNASGSAAQPT